MGYGGSPESLYSKNYQERKELINDNVGRHVVLRDYSVKEGYIFGEIILGEHNSYYLRGVSSGGSGMFLIRQLEKLVVFDSPILDEKDFLTNPEGMEFDFPDGELGFAPSP